MEQEPDPLIPEPTEEARKWYFRSHKKQRRGKEPGVPPPAPWYGVDPNAGAQDDEVHTFVHGPPNYSQVWTDYRAQGGPIQRPDPQHNTSPLGPILPKEMKWIRENEPDFNNIIFERKIGAGSFSKIWRVAVTKGGIMSLMACKVISIPSSYWTQLKSMNDKQGQISELVTMVDEMMADYSALKEIKHDNIVKIEKLITIPNQQTGFPFNTILLFEELCHGDLSQIIAHRAPHPLTEVECSHWFRQVASGLAFLHSHMITHCDIKPENIFFVNPQQITPPFTGNVLDMTFKLGDLGMVISYPDFPGQQTMTNKNTYRGTAGYMAPEMKTTGAFVDTAKADVYSLGLTLAKCLIGDRNFRLYRNLIYRDMQDIMNGRDVYNVSKHAATLLVQMINPNFLTRITIEQALNHYWVRTRTGIPAQVGSSSQSTSTIPFYYYPLMIGIAVGLTFVARRLFRR